MKEIVANPSLLIRRPITDVFEAFVDPKITSRFWFSSSDARLAPGARVTWTWGMYGFSTPVLVTAFEAPNRIAIEWDEGEDMTIVEWSFEQRGDNDTLVTVKHSGFRGSEEQRIKAALDGMNGFSLLLGAAKIWLEHGLEAKFVIDRHPDARVPGWEGA